MGWQFVQGQETDFWIFDEYREGEDEPYHMRCIFDCLTVGGYKWVWTTDDPSNVDDEYCDVCAKRNLRLFRIEDRNVDEKRMMVEHSVLRTRLKRRYNMFARLYYDYKRSARKRSYTFRLFPLEFYQLSQGTCHYCDVVPSQIKAYKLLLNETPFVYNGIDRMNNYVGYELANCVSCCWHCNKQKGTLPYEFFMRLKRG